MRLSSTQARSPLWFRLRFRRHVDRDGYPSMYPQDTPEERGRTEIQGGHAPYTPGMGVTIPTDIDHFPGKAACFPVWAGGLGFSSTVNRAFRDNRSLSSPKRHRTGMPRSDTPRRRVSRRAALPCWLPYPAAPPLRTACRGRYHINPDRKSMRRRASGLKLASHAKGRTAPRKSPSTKYTATIRQTRSPIVPPPRGAVHVPQTS